MYHNSTIRPKMGVCALCTDGKKKPLTKGLCQQHYWDSIKIKSAQKGANKEITEEEGLPELIEEADTLFSRFMRMNAADEHGMIQCYICESYPTRWQDAQLMHFIPRANLFLRWDPRNCRVGYKCCNEYKGGNLIEFGRKLNLEQPGITDILFEESRIIYKPTRDEVRKIIGEYSAKIKTLQKQKA
jgi:hypothetical protein